MEQHEEWQVVRRTEVTIETHTVTKVRKQPFADIELIKPEPDTGAANVPETQEPLIQRKWRRS